MDDLTQSILRTIAFSTLFIGSVVAGSGLISALTEFIDSTEGFIIVGLLLSLPGALILGFERNKSIKISGVVFDESKKKKDKVT